MPLESFSVLSDRKRKVTPVKTSAKKKVKLCDPVVTLDDSIGFENEKSNIIKTMSRRDLELLVQKKIIETIQVKSDCGELAKKVAKLSMDNIKLKEKAVNLQKQLADLTEVTKKTKVIKETKTVRIPKITRSVGLQVSSKVPAEVEKELKPTVIDIVAEVSEEIVDKISKGTNLTNVEEGIEKQMNYSKEVARKSTRGRLNTKCHTSDIALTEVEPLSLNVKKSAGQDNGVVLTWTKRLNTYDFSSIVNYELEGAKGSKGNQASDKIKWSRIGDPIEPLPLPMACNLNNFKHGVFYSFRVKLVTKNSSFYSNIASITMI